MEPRFPIKKAYDPGACVMRKPPDSLYLRAMRTKIGEELRSQYDLTKPLPNNLNELLKELDEEQEAPAPKKL
jgi:hypothetical protein